MHSPHQLNYIFATQEQCDVDAITYEGHTALHSAVAHGHYAIAELLIGYGIDLDATESNGCSALHLVLGVPGVEVRTVTTVPKSPELKKVSCASRADGVCTVGPLLVCVQ